jgi:hypothetical protein
LRVAHFSFITYM